MGKENCSEGILVQLTNEKSPTTGTLTDRSAQNSSLIVIVVGENGGQPNVHTRNNSNDEVSFLIECE